MSAAEITERIRVLTNRANSFEQAADTPEYGGMPPQITNMRERAEALRFEIERLNVLQKDADRKRAAAKTAWAADDSESLRRFRDAEEAERIARDAARGIKNVESVPADKSREERV